MQAVILAAGMGSRLGKYTAQNTKCMLSINGRTLIERALDALDEAGIRRCVIVAGYQKDNLMRFAGTRYKRIDITYIANDMYSKTNNIYSLYLAKDFLAQDDTLLLESDLIFESRIIKELLDNPSPTLAAVAPFESWMDGTVVRISAEGLITQVIPRKYFDFQEKASYYKTVNIYKFSQTFLNNSYIPFLEAYIRSMGNNEYYEQVLRVIAALDTHDLKAFVLSDQKWYEIDDVQDKDIAETIFADTPEEKLKLTARRFGGYWRFPKMLDFCYLVNPYFPTEQLRTEMRTYFDELMTEYPSGLNVQNLLTGKLFSVEPENILTGNGAAELIRALAPEMHGSIGVIYPTFNEYPESLSESGNIAPFYTETITYTVEQVLEWQNHCDTLTLINPDNPSGNFLPARDVLKLLETMKTQGKRLILDESFVDFSDMEEQPGLLKQDILEAYPNLIIVKSLSKSYGIAGLRLGALACGDRGLIQNIRKRLPIWNINAFAEYFLQIAGKYAKDYRRSCQALSRERRRFKAELEKTGLFEVYPSQANYFLCRCLGGFTAEELSRRLLEEHNIFIKDLTGKKGIPGTDWVRIAVRSMADNNTLTVKLSPPPPPPPPF